MSVVDVPPGADLIERARDRGMHLIWTPIGGTSTFHSGDLFGLLVASLGPVRATQIVDEIGEVWKGGRRDADAIERTLPGLPPHPKVRT